MTVLFYFIFTFALTFFWFTTYRYQTFLHSSLLFSHCHKQCDTVIICPGLICSVGCEECTCPSWCCSVQSLSCVQLCNPMDGSTPVFPVHHQLPEFAQTHVNVILCHPLLPPLASGSFRWSFSLVCPLTQSFPICGCTLEPERSLLAVVMRKVSSSAYPFSE